MNQSLFRATDPSQISEVFSDDGRGLDLETIKRSRDQRDTFKVALDKVPRRELDMLCAHHVQRKGQEEIARMYEVTQGDVSYRIKRARERIKLWMDISKIMTEWELREILYKLGYKTHTIEVVLGVYKTTSQSVCAESLGMTQGNVRHEFLSVKNEVKAIVAKGSSSDLERVNVLLVLLGGSWNRLRSLGVQKRFERKFQ